MKVSACLPVLVMPADAIHLYDNEQWENRYEIRSESSGRTYVVSQHRQGRHWGCSCPGWKSRRRCKHLDRFGLPGDCQPYEVEVRDSRTPAPVLSKPDAPARDRFVSFDDGDV